MPSDDLPFDPAHYTSLEDQAGLIANALRTILLTRHLSVDLLLPEDPRLSVTLAALDRLGIDLHAAALKPGS